MEQCLPEEEEEDDERHHDVEEEVDLDGFHIGGGREGPGYSGVESVCHCNMIVQQPNEKGPSRNGPNKVVITTGRLVLKCSFLKKSVQ